MKKLECELWLESRGITRNLVADYDWRSERIVGDIRESATMRESQARSDFIDKFGFAILHEPAIEAMRPYAPLLEIGAGSGYWSHELQRHGIDIVATDPKLWINSSWGNTHKHDYTKIHKFKHDAAIRYFKNRNLLIVWPEYKESWAAEAISMFTGETVIYMGEGYGNATADDRFHELLDSEFSNQIYVPMPHFWGNYDSNLVIASRPKQLK